MSFNQQELNNENNTNNANVSIFGEKENLKQVNHMYGIM